MTAHLAYGLSGGPLTCSCAVGKDHARTDSLQVRGPHAPEPTTSPAWGRLERRAALLEQVRRQAAAEEREACASRVYAWAAGLTSEHDRLVAAAAAEVVLEGR